MSVSPCCFNSSSYTNVLKYLCKDYLKCSFVTDPYINSRIPTCCASSLSKNLIVFSYVTIVVPLLVVLVLLALEFIGFICRGVSSGLKNLCYRKPQLVFADGLQLTEEGRKLLIRSLKEEYSVWKDSVFPQDLNKKTGDIEWLSISGVFRHRKIPGLIFRLPLRHIEFFGKSKKARVEEMVDFANRCRQVCQDKDLDLLVVPKVSSEDLGQIYGSNWHVLVMEEIKDFDGDFMIQNNLRRDLVEDTELYPLLRDLEKQIVEFVFLTEYDDVKVNNFPIMNRKGEEPLKAAIFDFDLYEPELKRALIGRGYRYEEHDFGMSLLLMLETKEALEEALERASKALPSYERVNIQKVLTVRDRLHVIRRKQKELFLARGLKTGLELISVNEIKRKDFENCSRPALAFETGKEIIQKINAIIKAYSIYEGRVRFGTCLLERNILKAMVGPEYEKKPSDALGCWNWNHLFRGSLLKEVCEVLVEKNIISSYWLTPSGIKFWF